MTDAVLDRPPQPAPPGGHVTASGEVDWVKIFLGFGGMVIGQFMAILDIQIVASSLSQIQAGVGASADEISWVQTIYLLAEVVIIPLTAYLTKMWGTRPVYVAAAAGFILTSILTGLSTSIEMMIFTRALQGLAAGAMIPAVFATAMTVFPPEKRVMANVTVGLIVTLAPTVGPTIGGHLTEALNWRWLFFVNIPPGLLVMFLVGRYGDFDKGDPSLAKGIDWFGLAVMTMFLLSMQYVIEEGSSEGWFDDDLILWLSVTAAITGAVFIWRQLTYRQPIVSLKPFTDRNFTIGFIMNAVSGMSLFGGTFILPLFLGQIRRFSAAEVGTTMLVSGLVMFMTAPVAGRFIRLVDPRIPLVVGFGLAAYGVGLGVHVTADWGFWEFAALQAIRGVGVMIAMIAAQQLSVSTLPPSMMKDASGLVNLVRNVGGAVGLAVLTTILTDQTAVHLSELSARVSVSSLQGQEMLQNLTAMMDAQGLMNPEGAARKFLGMALRRDAAVLGFADGFYFLAAGCAVASVLGLLASPAKTPPGPPGDGGGH
ncbi:DHA2 family efflux MFS transporter permease subunit [Phenylobacterium sp. Root700]|uniref:DHA2 family efflux MFS transporter permease subunit n=1 Tax=Phenylobacterium sp. Root700 TaxID=1736591 RepID=UPI0006FCE5C2|nr:DHA2 family efflux MFS transporter permease subunit [Phenylobacterium sp. Root700]KRB41729.1 MFS transporter [Phenylobacterium sp. Root700]